MGTPTLEQFQGAVVGSAIGDAMGCPTEFLSMAQITEKYGAQGVSDYVLFREEHGTRFAPYTDDTQMAEAVSRGLLENHQQLDAAMNAIATRFIEWEAQPQGGHRAPGRACLEGCQRLAAGSPWSEAGGRNAGGCGSVMRAYPFGLFFFNDVNKAESWAAEHSKLTHGAPIALAACAAMAVGTNMALQRQPVEAILLAMKQAAARYSPETAFMLQKAAEAPAEKERSMKSWYEGWAAHEAIAISAYLFKIHWQDPRSAILAAINSPGDSDSIGALVGALVGAYHGLSLFPEQWINELERSQELMALANAIYHATPDALPQEK